MGDFGYSASGEEVDYIIADVKATPIPADGIDKTFRSGCIGGLSPAPCPPPPPDALLSAWKIGHAARQHYPPWEGR